MPVMPAAGSVWPTFALPLPTARMSSGSRFESTTAASERTPSPALSSAVERRFNAIAAEPQTVAASDAAAPAQPFYAVRTRTGGPRTTETVEVYFPIRLGQNVALRLPADVTREELDRFALFLKSLPVREPLNDD